MRLYRSTINSRRREKGRRFHELRIQNENGKTLKLIDMVEGSFSIKVTLTPFELDSFYSSVHSHTVEGRGI